MQYSTVQQNELLRKARRRRRRRKALSGSYPVRLALVFLGGVAGAFVLFNFLSKAVHPYRLGYETSRQVREARAKLDEQEAMNAELERRIAFLKSPEGVESEARRLGYYRRGETVYLLHREGEGPAAAPDAVNESPQVPQE